MKATCRRGSAHCNTSCTPPACPHPRQESRHHFSLHRAEELVEACAEGDLAHIQMLLDEDCPADAAEFDGRTGLMLATARCACRAVASAVIRC
jgi:hypothetical protein